MATIEQKVEFLNGVLIPLGLDKGIAYLEVIGFLASEGSQYANELMLVGRATRGWDVDKIAVRNLVGSAAEQYAEEVFDSVTPKDECPMSWVIKHWGIGGNEYNTKKSAFWRTAKRVSEGSGVVKPETRDWSSHLVWSNLYKIAMPDSNPSNMLANSQFQGCSSLLMLEIRQFLPKRILMSTGLDWARPFISPICVPESVVEKDGFVQCIGQLKPEYGGARLVVAQHPMGKPEDLWVAEVLDAFSAGR